MEFVHPAFWAAAAAVAAPLLIHLLLRQRARAIRMTLPNVDTATVRPKALRAVRLPRQSAHYAEAIRLAIAHFAPSRSTSRRVAPARSLAFIVPSIHGRIRPPARRLGAE